MFNCHFNEPIFLFVPLSSHLLCGIVAPFPKKGTKVYEDIRRHDFCFSCSYCCRSCCCPTACCTVALGLRLRHTSASARRCSCGTCSRSLRWPTGTTGRCSG